MYTQHAAGTVRAVKLATAILTSKQQWRYRHERTTCSVRHAPHTATTRHAAARGRPASRTRSTGPAAADVTQSADASQT